MHRTRLLFFIFFLLGSIANSHAAVDVAVEIDIAPAYTRPFLHVETPHEPVFAAGGPSSTDLLEGMEPIAFVDEEQFGCFGCSFTEEGATGTPALTNGEVGTYYNKSETGGLFNDNHTAYFVASEGDSLTYALGDSFDLTSIVVFGGWNDGGRDRQHYVLSTSTDGVIFTELATLQADVGDNFDNVTPMSFRAEFTEDAGPYLAQDTTHLRIDFADQENNYAGYTEIDVFGVATTVPEPSTLVTFLTLFACPVFRTVLRNSNLQRK